MKRFTETQKWGDRWFSALPLKHKVIWLYLCDNCDAAGVWEPNIPLAEFQTGIKRVEWEGVRQAFDKTVRVLGNGKWWVPGFVAFQYGEKLHPEARVHASIIAMLEKHGLWDDYQNWLKSRKINKEPSPDSNTMAIPLVWDKVKEKEQDKAKVDSPSSDSGQAQAAPKTITAADIYAAYPRKIAKHEALKAIERAVERIGREARTAGLNPGEWLIARVRDYAAATALWPKDDHRFIPYPATWFNAGRYDDDPETWIRGKADSQQKIYKAPFA